LAGNAAGQLSNHHPTFSNTKTTAGLKIEAMLTRKTYPTGIEVPAAAMAQLNPKPDGFHGDWN